MKTKYLTEKLSKTGVIFSAVLFMLTLISGFSMAQCPAPTYSGSQVVCVGDVTTYVVTNPVAGGTYNWSVATSYGTILGSGITPPPSNLPYVSVRWDNPASGAQAWVRASYTTPNPNPPSGPDGCNVVGAQYFVTVNPLPLAYEFKYEDAYFYFIGDNSTNAYYCHENTGVTLSVMGSDNTTPATTYELRRVSDDFTAATINGTGSKITFSNVTVQNHSADAASSTTYYVVARNPQVCQTSMLGTVTVHKFAKVLPGVIATTTPSNIGACENIAPAFTSTTGASGGYSSLDYQWQININSGGWNDISGEIGDTYTHSALTVPGTYEFRREVTNYCAIVYSNVISITVDAIVTANAGLDKTIGICTPSVVINGSGTGTATLTYSWVPTDYLSDPLIAAPTFNNPGIEGDYDYVLTVTDAYGCIATDGMSVTVDPAPTASVGVPYGVNSDNKIGACSGQQIAINATATGTDIDILWTGSGATYLDINDIEDPIFSGAPTGTYSITITVTDDYGCVVSDVLTITVDPLPTAAAGLDGDICVGQTYNISGSASGTGYEILWTGSGAPYLNNTTIATPVFNNLLNAIAGTYTLTITVTDDYGCTATDDLVVNVYDLPDPDAGTDYVVCDATSYQLVADPSPGSSGIWTWDGPGTVTFIIGTVTSTNPTIQVDVAGVYTLTWTETSLYCPPTALSDDVLITFLKGTIADAYYLDPIPDVDAVSGAPVATLFKYYLPTPDTGADPNIIMDGLIATNVAWPADAKVVEIRRAQPITTTWFPIVNGDLGGKEFIFLSDIIGLSNPLFNNINPSYPWVITVEGFDGGTYEMEISLVTYITKPTDLLVDCYAILDSQEYTMSFDDAVVTAPTDCVETCYDIENDLHELGFTITIEYPTISNIDVNNEIGADALITITDGNAFNNVTLYWGYNAPATNLSSTSLNGKTSIYLSEIVGSSPAPLNGHSSLTDNWYIKIVGLNPGYYEMDVEALALINLYTGTQIKNNTGVGLPQAQPTDFTDFEYTYAEDDFCLNVIGSDEVSIDAISDISTVTGAPIVVPINVNYGTLSAENIDPSVMADALISFDGTLPATAKIVELKFGTTTITTNYSLANADDVLLSDVVVAGGFSAPNPLNGHADNSTDTWTVVFAGIDTPGTYTVTVQGIAYVGTYSTTACYSVTAEEEFVATWANMTVCTEDPDIVCVGSNVESEFLYTFPVVTTNNPSSIGFDIEVTCDVAIPAGTVVDYLIASTPISGSFTMVAGQSAGVPFYLSTYISPALPWPLFDLSTFPLSAELVIKNLPAGVYVLEALPVAELNGAYYSLVYTNGNTPCNSVFAQTIEVYGVPDATISGDSFVFSGGEKTYSVAEHLYGTPTYAWSSDYPSDVVIDSPAAYSTDIEFLWSETFHSVTVTLTAVVGNGVCTDTKTFEVYVKPNQLVGQLKYYNAAESPMPSPFNTNYNGMTVPDYFWVALVSSTFNVESDEPYYYNLEVRKVQEYYPEEGFAKFGSDNYHPLLTEDEYYEAAFGFNYNLNPDAEYGVIVWDGGYYEELISPGFGYLGQAWTWNNWPNAFNGGVNATDALLIQHMSVNSLNDTGPALGYRSLPPYNDFDFDVADANNIGPLSNPVTALDALLAQRRGIGLLQKFPNDKPNFSVGSIFVADTSFNTNKTFGSGSLPELFSKGSGYSYIWSSFASEHFYYSDIDSLLGEFYLNIYYNAVGDINSSFYPVYGGFKNEMKLMVEGELAVNMGDVVEIPVRMEGVAELGAITLGLKFDNKLIEVLETNYDAESAYISNEEGVINIIWADRNGASFDEGEAILTIRARVTGNINAGTELLSLNEFSELANINAEVVQTNLKTVGLNTTARASALTATNYPNPFTAQTTISYNLPEPGQVRIALYDKMGQEISTLFNAYQNTGVQTFEFTSDLAPGAYYYRITLRGENGDYTVTRSMIVVR